jgi:hypothetical protein
MADVQVGSGTLRPDPSETAMQAETDSCRCVGRGSTWQYPGVRGEVGARSSPEDTGLCIRIAASVAGARWVYTPNAIVGHHVPVARASFSYFLKRNYLGVLKSGAIVAGIFAAVVGVASGMVSFSGWQSVND